MNTLRLALRTLRREWRLPELRTLALALVLAVAALGAVATLAARVERALLDSAAELIGGDLGVSARAPLPAELAAQARTLGLEVGAAASFPSVAFAGDRSQLLDVQAVDDAYPLRGTLQLGGADGRGYAGHGIAAGSVALDHRALVALGLRVGERVQLGGRDLAIAAELVRQPDGGELFALAPRVLMNLGDAEAAGLLGVGSRARHRLMLAGAPAALAAFQRYAEPRLPAGGEILTPAKTQERLSAAFDRGEAFLRLAALLAALLAGVAIALAAQRYARRKTDEVALLRALGAPRRQVLATLALILTLIALPAAALGGALALGLAEGVFALAHGLFPQTQAALPLAPVLAAAGAGLAVLAGFAFPPLARLAEVPPVAVFRRTQDRRVRRFDVLYLVPLLVAVLLIAAESGSLRVAGILAGSLGGVALAAGTLAALLLALARRLAPGAHPALRLGLSSLARRRGLTLVQATAIALGLTALLLLAVVAPALLDGWRRELPADTPNWFVLNLQDDQREALGAELAHVGADQLNMLPLAVGKLAAINGRAPRAEDFADPRAKEWLDNQLRLSWSAALPQANHVAAGRWFAPQPTEAEVSVDRGWAQTFGLKLGDTLTFAVGDRALTARITSLRGVDWSSFRVNFFLLLDPAHAAELPHTWIASFHLDKGRGDALAAVARAHPNLTLIDVNALLDRIRDIIGRVTGAVRWVLGFSLLAGALVLAAALSASARERRHEAALLRTLGARGRQLTAAVAAEFAALGLIAGLTAAGGAAGAGLWFAARVLKLDGFVPPLAPLIGAALAAAVAVTLLGLAGTRRVLRTPPLAVLRRG
ncbi:MAG: ABC transporter permease [Xanthomonadaceae bacterium]|nr:ABC transporter permease [Xanthomonadaceae bacterium]